MLGKWTWGHPKGTMTSRKDVRMSKNSPKAATMDQNFRGLGSGHLEWSQSGWTRYTYLEFNTNNQQIFQPYL